MVTVHNFDDKAHEVTIKPGVTGGEKLVDLREEAQSLADENGAHRIALDAHGYRWYRVGGLNYALNRT